MPKTFTNEPLGHNWRHTCRVRGTTYYVMGKSWIDTTAPRDMMDYDLTMSWPDLLKLHDKCRLDHIRAQSLTLEGHT